MTQYSVLGMTFTTHLDAPLIGEADILFLQKKEAINAIFNLILEKKDV